MRVLPKVYIASKMQHAARWRELYTTAFDYHFTARWPFLEPCIDATPYNAVRFWQDDLYDIQACDALIVYAEPGEHLRGALVEAGMAIALGKPVYVVGEHPDYGTWQHHPLVFQEASLHLALTAIRLRMRLTVRAPSTRRSF